MVGNGPKSDDIGKSTYDPFEDLGEAKTAVFSLDSKRQEKSSPGSEKITEAKVLEYCQYLSGNQAKIDYLNERGIDDLVIAKYEIGFDEGRGRYSIPIRDADGSLVNIRRYDSKATPKMTNAMGHGSPPRLFPLRSLSADEVLICEGEWDALVSTSHGIPAVTGTHGAATWNPRWSKLFEDKHVLVCYDNDREGRIGAKKVAASVLKHARSVRIVRVPVPDEHGDISDMWQLPNAEELWQNAVATSRPFGGDESAKVEAQTASVKVIGSMDGRTNGKPLEMNVTVTGKKDPTYSIPRVAMMTCGMDAGPKCKTCVMATEYEGEKMLTIDPKNVRVVSEFIDANKSQVLEVLRNELGAAKCNRLKHEEIENQSVEEIFVTGSMDRIRSVEEADYTHRRIYNVGSHQTATNTSAIVRGTTVPSHKDRHNEFFAWDLKEAITSIDKFEVTNEFMDRMKVFVPSDDQTPSDKCLEIAHDLADNVTGITGRDDLHMAYDLVFHSALGFNLDGKPISRGWLEFLVIGDTRTGKSETALHLVDHYGLGHVVGCEGATFAGLVGGVKQIGDKWTVTWGEITLNDRRLVVLDEASGLSQEIISQLSDVRSRGEAQLTKVERHQTKARCRLIWISNPRKSHFVDEKKYDGIDLIEDLIGNPEDIARFDFAMSVSQSDVSGSEINRFDRDKVDHVYTSDLCRELILWAWSRKPDQVIWEDDAYRQVYKQAEALGKRYIDDPPLIQRSNVREKIARTSVALAARTFSADETGENIVVGIEHVNGAVKFLDGLYSMDNFGYRRLSKRVFRNRRIAAKNRDMIKSWLLSNPRLIEFLLDRRGSFRAPDLEEMAHMLREEVNIALGRLSDAKMISKQKSQIIVEPELNGILKEIERERRK